MPLHVKLDFTAPFTVGDTIYSSYPPGDHKYTGGPSSYDSLEGKISSVKFELELNHDNSCLVKEAITEKELTVKAVVYTVMPSAQPHLSPFTVECNLQPDSHPMLFASEAELRAYQHPV
ncbi:hypothetical protein [Spirosoma validum]|uniref:Uncharacterized protein n=1 Tax=Spirosoma validum TaxID=2771355 RepID=A0A927B0M0_9BACT|nr:hypothetical protein [Spirosoma validum]MBD2753349.1 hypothetical protein [Spirosoma validum]